MVALDETIALLVQLASHPWPASIGHTISTSPLSVLDLKNDLDMPEVQVTSPKTGSFFGNNDPLPASSNPDQPPPTPSVFDDPCERGGAGSYVVTGAVLKLQQFNSLIIKRFYQTRRNLKGLSSQVFLPSFFITVAMVFALSVPKPKDAPPLLLNTGMFHRPNCIPFANEGTSKLSIDMDNTLKLPSGIGSFCLVQNFSSHFNKSGYSYPCDFKKSKLRRQMTRMFNRECADAVNEISDVYLCGNHNISRKLDGSEGDRGCHCSSDGRMYVCSVSGTTPKELIPATMDTLRNITGRNVTRYLLHTMMETRMKRFGVFYHMLHTVLLVVVGILLSFTAHGFYTMPCQTIAYHTTSIYHTMQ